MRVSLTLVMLALVRSTTACTNVNELATDYYFNDCGYYQSFPSRCGIRDDFDFDANLMCCACGGGSTGCCGTVTITLPPGSSQLQSKAGNYILTGTTQSGRLLYQQQGGSQYLFYDHLGDWNVGSGAVSLYRSSNAQCPSDMGTSTWMLAGGSNGWTTGSVDVTCAAHSPPPPPSPSPPPPSPSPPPPSPSPPPPSSSSPPPPSPSPPSPSPPPPPSPSPPPPICANDCWFARDNACDDGGEGSEHSFCSVASDCHDCGPRPSSSSSASSATSPGPSAPPPPSSPPGPGPNGGLVYITIASGLFAVFLVVLLVMDKLGKKKGNGWGPLGMRFPKDWAMVWVGYWLMLIFSIYIMPLIIGAIMLAIMPWTPSGPSVGIQAIETIIALGPFFHCLLMPCFWYRTHRRKSKVVPEEPPQTPELDPEAKTVIFAMKHTCCDKLVILFVGLLVGLVSKVLWLVKTISAGTLNFEAFWFPAPFFNFWEAKLLIKMIRIDGCKLRTKACQDDAYMKFCTEACLGFWTLGLYAKVCAKKANFNKWLDRSIVWVGKPPKGYNNQFRIFDDKFGCGQKIKIFFVLILLTCAGGFLRWIPFCWIPFTSFFWPVALLFTVYKYKVALSNMKFGGAKPGFSADFTYCNYICKWYTIGACGFCGGPLKRWVDAQIVMGKPEFDQEQADEEAEQDAAEAADGMDTLPTSSTTVVQVHSPPVVQVQTQELTVLKDGKS